MSVETIFGITQTGRPCKICLRKGGYCHHHISRQGNGGRASSGHHHRQQPMHQSSAAEDENTSNQRVFGYTQRGLPCKICLRKGEFCHLHQSQGVGNGQTSTPQRSRDEMLTGAYYGITLKGLPCKICIRKGGYCRKHEHQRHQREPPPPPPPPLEPYSTSPTRETHRIQSPSQAASRYSSNQETRRVSPDSTGGSPRPARVHDVERQRLLYGNLDRGNADERVEASQTRNSLRRGRGERRQMNSSSTTHRGSATGGGITERSETSQARNSPRQSRSERRHIESSSTTRRSSAEERRTRSSSRTRRVSVAERRARSSSRTRSAEEQRTRSSSRTRRRVRGRSLDNSPANISSSERQGRGRSEGPPAEPAESNISNTTLNMSNQEMEEQYCRFLGLFSEYMRVVQQDEDESRQTRRNISASRGRGDGFPETGDVRDGDVQSRHSVDSLREFVNESMAAVRCSPQRRSSNGFPAVATTATSVAQTRAPAPALHVADAAASSTAAHVSEGSSPEEGSSSSISIMECSICLENLKDGRFPEFLPCGHGFHCGCLEQWRSYSNCCPLCRNPTVNGY